MLRNEGTGRLKNEPHALLCHRRDSNPTVADRVQAVSIHAQESNYCCGLPLYDGRASREEPNPGHCGQG